MRSMVLLGVPALLLAVVTPAQAATQPACGDEITTSTTLTADLVCEDVGLVVATDRVVLDLGGHALSGKIALSVEGASRAVVRNGSINGHRTGGVSLRGTRDLVFDTVTLSAGIDAADARDTTFQRVRQTGRSAEMLFTGYSQLRAQDSAFEAYAFRCTDRSTCRLVRSTTTISDYFTCDDTSQWHVTGGKLTATWISCATLAVTGADLTTFRVTTKALTISDARVGGGMILQTNTARIVRTRFSGGQAALMIVRIEGGTIRQNTFADGRAAGLFVNVATPAKLAVEANAFTANGHLSELVDLGGNAVKDGAHLHTGEGSSVEVTGNRATGNARYGIWAQPWVVDDGRNTTHDDPLGCLNVACIPV
ncbi:right-handed parallel beta-helix repeat-containing protein [Lentzea sp. NPDC003310]|uniref:right-handed parallel beta-helix repeat-containing protein n=1 Tax=Lentzea sp. NPDC003310 TaxID=3154447 RepID=UPI0033A21CF1